MRLNFFTHHKCASAWLSTYLNEFCKLNSLDLFATHYSNIIPDEFCAINVFANASYPYIMQRFDQGIHIIRNPLDVIVSAYYSHKNTHPIDDWPQLAEQRVLLDKIDEGQGLFVTLAFLERDNFYSGAVGTLHGLRHWNFEDDRFVTLRMEDLVQNPGKTLGSLLRSRYPMCCLPSDDRYTFEGITGRRKGEIDETSHYRSGKADQWKEILPPAIVEYIKINFSSILLKYYPDCLNIA